MQPALARSTRAGRYELVAELGRGGMAELYVGRLVGVGGFAKAFAIKRILPHLSSDPRFVQMFLNEGRIASHLSHPNVCQVYELGEADAQLFLVMEYLEGVSWDDLALALPRVGLRVAAGVIGQICEGLHYAHELRDLEGRPTSVVHRDVSPQNMFVTVDGVCKVLDFGVSKMATDDRLTRSGIVKGKLSYMPPEQIRGEEVDARADVFAAGVVLWEALAGTRLFARATDYLIWRAITEEPIPPIAAYDPSYGPALDAVVGRALARDRDQRYPSIRAFADDLRAVAEASGGPCTPTELAALVRAHCAPQLAERSRQLALAVGAAPRAMFADTEPVDAIPPAETQSMMLRAESIAIERARPRRRWRWSALALGLALAAVALALAALALRDPQPRGEPIAVQLDEPAASVNGTVRADDAPPLAVASTPPRPAPRRPVVAQAPHRPPPVQPSGPPPTPGYFSIDSRPYATIYVDGKRLDHTPLYRAPLPAGRHAVRAVLAGGRQRDFVIAIDPGKELSSGTLSW